MRHQGGGEIGEDVGRDHRVLAQAFCRAIARVAVEEHTQTRRGERFDPACQQGREDAGLHVPASRGGHARVAAGIDGHRAVRLGYQGSIALEYHHRSRSFGQGPRGGKPVGLDLLGRHHAQPCRLAGVRG